MTQIVQKSENSNPLKSTIASFVHDMAELEKKELTLKQAAEACKQKADSITGNAFFKKNDAYTKLQEARHNNSVAQSNQPIYPKEVKKPETVHCPEVVKKPDSFFWIFLFNVLVLTAIFGIATIVVVFFLSFFISRGPTEYYWPIVGLIVGIFGLIMLIYRIVKTILDNVAYSEYLQEKENYDIYKKKKSEYDNYLQVKKMHEDTEKQISIAQNACSWAQRNYDNALIDERSACAQSQVLKQRAEILLQQAELLEEQKEELYTLGIIPPDYREIDCILMFDQIFRNDLADTMREAVKIYEERVFRGEVIRGLTNIYNKLDELASTMSSVVTVLHSIQSEVRMMSDDLYQAVQNQQTLIKLQEENNALQEAMLDEMSSNRSAYEKSLDLQKELITETRASRYAMESIKTSNEKYDYYINLHRQGLL